MANVLRGPPAYLPAQIVTIPGTRPMRCQHCNSHSMTNHMSDAGVVCHISCAGCNMRWDVEFGVVQKTGGYKPVKRQAERMAALIETGKIAPVQRDDTE